MSITVSLIGTGVLPVASETPFVRKSGGPIAYGFNDLVYQADDFVTFNLGVIAGFPFGVTNAGAVSGYLLSVNDTDDIRVSSDLEDSTYVNDRSFADFYFAVGSGLADQSQVIFYDAATGQISLSNDGGLSTGASFACDLDFSSFPLGLNVTQNTIIEIDGVYYFFGGYDVGTYYSSDLATWFLDAASTTGYFCETESAFWVVGLSGSYVQISVSGETASFINETARGIKLVPDGDTVLLYLFDDAENFTLYQLSQSASPVVNGGQSGNQGAVGGGVNGAGGAIGFSGVTLSNARGLSVDSLAYPDGINPRGMNDFGIDLGM